MILEDRKRNWATAVLCAPSAIIDWTFLNVSSVNSKSQFTGVCRTRLLSTWWTTARVHRTSQAANALDRPTVTSWWFSDTVAARLDVGLSAVPMEWTRSRTLSGTLLRVPTALDRLWRLICSQRSRDEQCIRGTAWCTTTTITNTIMLIVWWLFLFRQWQAECD